MLALNNCCYNASYFSFSKRHPLPVTSPYYGRWDNSIDYLLLLDNYGHTNQKGFQMQHLGRWRR